MTTASVTLSLALIDRNLDQPRADFQSPEAVAAIEALADSIRANGLIEPILVRPKGDRYEIVAGENRYRAHVRLCERGIPGFDVIRANVREMTDQERDIIAIVENVQRRDLKPMEEARAYKRLLDQGLTPAEIAERTGQAKFRIDWRLSLLNLDDGIVKLLDSGQIDRQSAMELSRLPAQHDQRRVLSMLNTGQLKGWKALRNAVDAVAGGMTQADIFGDAPRATDADVAKVRGMEAKIESVAAMVGAGWKSGECIIANKVDPGRATAMADRIAAINAALRIMERELRNTAAQAQLAVTTKAA